MQKNSPDACSKDVQVSGKQSGYYPLNEKNVIRGTAKCVGVRKQSLELGCRTGGHFPGFLCQGNHILAYLNSHPFRGAFHKSYARLDLAVGEALGLFRDDELHLHSSVVPSRFRDGIVLGYPICRLGETGDSGRHFPTEHHDEKQPFKHFRQAKHLSAAKVRKSCEKKTEAVLPVVRCYSPCSEEAKAEQTISGGGSMYGRHW